MDATADRGDGFGVVHGRATESARPLAAALPADLADDLIQRIIEILRSFPGFPL